MLGRHGDNLFWMARYLERSENLARRIQATLHYALSREDEGEEEWTALIMNHGLGPLFEEKYDDPTTIDIINFLLRDRDNFDSVASLMSKARNNGRSVRTSLTREVWLSLNESWMKCESDLKRPVNIRDLPVILEDIIKGSSLFRGALYGTMLHNDIFNFLRLGTFIERADNTIRTIDTKYYRLLPTAKVIGGSNDQGQWEVMLRSLAAWRSFNWLKKGRLDPLGVANFLIFDERMPRSIKFCYKEVKSNLEDLSNSYKKDYGSLALANEIFIGLNDDNLQNTQEIDLKVFLTEHIEKNNQLSQAIASDFNMN
ncbi:alpha-E domain-containing protein [Alphaproteobacteria bacterium LSUCC0744]